MSKEMEELERREGAVEYHKNSTGPSARSLGTFLKKTGKMGGGDSPAYYCGYVLCEKLRIWEGEEDEVEGGGGADVSSFCMLFHYPRRDRMEWSKLSMLVSVLMRHRYPGGLVREDPAREVYYLTKRPDLEFVWEPQGRESDYYYNLLAKQDLYGLPTKHSARIIQDWIRWRRKMPLDGRKATVLTGVLPRPSVWSFIRRRRRDDRRWRAEDKRMYMMRM